MIHTIKNEKLEVSIASLGAELQSIKTADGTEYLWQGDPRYWPDRATNIFPYVARLTNETYTFEGKQYKMKIHGFLSAMDVKCTEKSDISATFTLESTDFTKKMYPFDFIYEIAYTIEGDKIIITFRVKNRDEKTMYFGLGGHPGFNVPIGREGNFDDWYLEFAEKAEPIKVGMSETCFVTGEDEPFELKDGKYLPLYHSMFDNDAIILRDMCRKVTLKSEKSSRAVTVTYPDLGYLGIWHCPRSKAEYVCIEPWSSLPARQDVIEDIAKQPDLISLLTGEIYENTWSIEIK